MKRLKFVLFLLSLATGLVGQNRLVNHSVEQGNCPVPDDWLQQGPSEVHYFVPSCGTAPNNQYGTQAASDGDRYFGIRAWDRNSNFTRNHFAIPIDPPLVQGQAYDLWMDVSLAEVSRYASPSIGVKFSQGVNPVQIQVTTQPDAMFSNHGSDIVNWNRISLTLIAPVNANWMVLGGFNINGNGFFVNPNGSFDGTYCFVDNVCLSDQFSGCGIVMASGDAHKDTSRRMDVSTGPGWLKARGAAGEVILSDISGKVIESGNKRVEASGLDPGVYIVRDQREARKVVLLN